MGAAALRDRALLAYCATVLHDLVPVSVIS